MCKQNTTVELIGLLHIFFFRDKGEAVEKSGSWGGRQGGGLDGGQYG